MSSTLHVIFGPSGAGKTTYAHAFARREKAVAFILDEWMARLFAPDMPEKIEYEWMLDRVARCEAQIWSTAAGALAAGTSVILDIGLMRRADRARVREIAEATGLPIQWHFVTASTEARRARVAERNVVRGENFAIEVTPEMFEFVEGVFEGPEPFELEGAVIIEGGLRALRRVSFDVLIPALLSFAPHNHSFFPPGRLRPRPVPGRTLT
ncbi:ATP-binding protein [Phenylobacterium sp. J367]|uniref:AAA family ATPase n=1 Tax=Phenylobacterium sp. J367 TaxID=2898435 RepID=UPI0021515FC5|nr:ATP-binding protein [Phenylobacterium sp. J367]MCR5877052.1 ATP-binding protein [Phenylobacterium sp. J367]